MRRRVTLIRTKPQEEAAAAIGLTADSAFGLTASVWTTCPALASQFTEAVAVGTCFVNWCNDVHPQIVWSGVGESGNGAGAMGTSGFHALTYTKSVLVNGLASKL